MIWKPTDNVPELELGSQESSTTYPTTFKVQQEREKIDKYGTNYKITNTMYVSVVRLALDLSFKGFSKKI